MQTTTPDFLSVDAISVREEGNLILDNISFELPANHKMAVAGATGSGKSTLLQTIAGLAQPAAGEVLFEGTKVKRPHDVLVPGHPGIAYLSQQYELPKSLRVEQVLKYTNTLTSDEAAALYELCRISHLLKRKTNQLSGGERQRIALARLLTSSPSLLLLDEPYSNLDVAHKNILKAVIQDIGDELDITCMLISHDPTDTLSWADDILIMQEGKLIQKGSPYQIYHQPVSEYAAALFGKYNLIPASKAHAFNHLPGLQLNGKSLLVRPEHLNMTNAVNATLHGTVSAVTFFGSYYEAKVQLSELLITVRTQENQTRVGDTVNLTVAPEKIWQV